MQVVYLRPGNMLKRSMGKYIPIEDRLALQSSSNELNRILCHLASKRAGYLIEDFTQVGPELRNCMGLAAHGPTLAFWQLQEHQLQM